MAPRDKDKDKNKKKVEAARVAQDALDLSEALKASALRAQVDGNGKPVVLDFFGRYLTDDIVETLLDSPEGLNLGGERREITILMADIRGFTKISSQLGPEKVVTLVNNFLSEMTQVIISRGGTIDEFIGDGIGVEALIF
mgnify:CR=1 FL=1